MGRQRGHWCPPCYRQVPGPMAIPSHLVSMTRTPSAQTYSAPWWQSDRLNPQQLHSPAKWGQTAPPYPLSDHYFCLSSWWAQHRHNISVRALKSRWGQSNNYTCWKRAITALPKSATELGGIPARAIKTDLHSSWIDGLLMSQRAGVRNSLGLFMILGPLDCLVGCHLCDNHPSVNLQRPCGKSKGLCEGLSWDTGYSAISSSPHLGWWVLQKPSEQPSPFGRCRQLCRASCLWAAPLKPWLHVNKSSLRLQDWAMFLLQGVLHSRAACYA